MNQAAHHYQQIEKAITYLHSQLPKQVSLNELAEHISGSPIHFQRLFAEWAGVSPKKYLQFITLRHAKKRLLQAKSLAVVSEEAGLSATSRLHDLFVRFEGITPGEYKASGQNLLIHYGIHATPFGQALIAATKRGLCKLAFTNIPADQIQELKAEWPLADIKENAKFTLPFAGLIFGPRSPGKGVRLWLKGTPFQLKVWEALLRIPEGGLVTYSHIAEAIGMPKAVRAVGTAIGQNPVGYLIPCHRVIRKAGGFGDYRWGNSRKLALIGWEASKNAEPEIEQGSLW